MWCGNCGKELVENTAFCPNCGEKVILPAAADSKPAHIPEYTPVFTPAYESTYSEDSVPKEVEVATTDSVDSLESANHKVGKKIFVLVTAVVLVLVLTIVAYVLLKNPTMGEKNGADPKIETTDSGNNKMLTDNLKNGTRDSKTGKEINAVASGETKQSDNEDDGVSKVLLVSGGIILIVIGMLFFIAVTRRKKGKYSDEGEPEFDAEDEISTESAENALPESSVTTALPAEPTASVETATTDVSEDEESPWFSSAQDL